MGRRGVAHHGKRAAKADASLESLFKRLSDGIIEWLDNGNYAAFSEAVEALNDECFLDPEAVDPDAPKEDRIVALATRFVAANKGLADLGLARGALEMRRDMALAELIVTAAEPTAIPQYWQKLVRRIQAEGIRQPDIHPCSRAMAKHVAAAIRDFKATGGAEADETYDDLPIGSWAELPPEFAGFRLVDFDKSDTGLRRAPCPLPPSTDIAYYTEDQRSLEPLSTRRETYIAWSEIIVKWCARTGLELNHQHPAIWAMLLAYRMDNDGSDVDFWKGMLIESPWQQGELVIVEVVPYDARF